MMSVDVGQSMIQVSIKNLTQGNVAFFLNGGVGLNTTLATDKQQQYNMVVDPGVQPIVGIYQPNEPRVDFKVKHNGIYYFVMREGKIVLLEATPTTIKVRFKNKTQSVVNFFLNGGAGLETTLAPGRVQSYTMVVDPGVPPIVGVHQPDGTRLDFKVFHDVRYAFIMQNGKIICTNNFFFHKG